MSDNIDYAELDKAVNEAMQTQSSRPVSRVATSRPVAKRPVARPQSRGRFMDFAPRGNHVRTVTPARPVQKPVARPVVAPQPRPVVRAAKPVSTIPPKTSRPSVATKIQQKQQRVATTKEAPKPKVVKKVEAPDANSYSLGGRSPFLADTKVEKRPLGTNIPETSTTAVRSTKNVYSQKNPSKSPVSKRKKHTVTEAPKSYSGWLWTFVVLFVIAAGAGLGYLAYLIVFAN